MFIYQGQSFNDFGKLKKEFNLVNANEIAKENRTSFVLIRQAIDELGLQYEKVLRTPSNTYVLMNRKEDVKDILKQASKIYRNDNVPEDYIQRFDYAKLLGVPTYFLNTIKSRFPEFENNAKYFYVRNIRVKFYRVDDVSLSVARDIIERTRIKEVKIIPTNQESKNIAFRRRYLNGNLHKVAIDTIEMEKIFDTSSPYYSRLIDCYRRFATIQIADSALMDNHHIIPRFYEHYICLEDLENTIYLSREHHLLVHILEYRCALQQYKTKFFGSLAILTSRTEPEKIDEKKFRKVEDALLSSLE